MKRITLWVLFVSTVSTNVLIAQSRKDIIINYENVQGGIVGKTLPTFQNGQALFGTVLAGIVTKDEPSSSEQTKDFNNKFTLGISTLFKVDNLKDFKVEATNVKVTNVNNDVETLPTGSRIIMSAFKADSVVITMTKKRKYNLSLSQLMDKIKKYAPVSEASTLNVLSLIDSANYQRNTSLKIVIKNPNVYYAFIAGQIKSVYATNAYLDIPSALKGQTTIKINTVSDDILPKSSDEFQETGFARRFLLNARVNEAGAVELYIQATKQDGGVDEIKVPKTGNNWTGTNLGFKSIVLGKATKRYYVDISAHLSDDGKSIIIDKGAIRYPEWVFNAIPRKYL